MLLNVPQPLAQRLIPLHMPRVALRTWHTSRADPPGTPQAPWKAAQRWGSGSVPPPRGQASLFLLCHPWQWLLCLPKRAGRFSLGKPLTIQDP